MDNISLENVFADKFCFLHNTYFSKRYSLVEGRTVITALASIGISVDLYQRNHNFGEIENLCTLETKDPRSVIAVVSTRNFKFFSAVKSAKL